MRGIVHFGIAQSQQAPFIISGSHYFSDIVNVKPSNQALHYLDAPFVVLDLSDGTCPRATPQFRKIYLLDFSHC
jgi:hypothetical protein